MDEAISKASKCHRHFSNQCCHHFLVSFDEIILNLNFRVRIPGIVLQYIIKFMRNQTI